MTTEKELNNMIINLIIYLNRLFNLFIFSPIIISIYRLLQNLAIYLIKRK
jgi:hypothetical protein